MAKPPKDIHLMSSRKLDHGSEVKIFDGVGLGSRCRGSGFPWWFRRRDKGGFQKRITAISEDLYKSFGRNMWRTRSKAGPVLAGRLVGAVREELAKGTLVGGKSHLRKGAETIRGLENWIKNNPNASQHDLATAKKWLQDLKDAFGTVNPGQFITK